MITQEREELILQNFVFNVDLDKIDELILIFNSLNSEELHYLAENYNWDNGLEVLESIVESPICDKVIAFLIYRRSDPMFLTRYENEEESRKDCVESFDLLKKAEKNLLDGFYKT